jgi:type II secretory pathway pseudopilin PulG
MRDLEQLTKCDGLLSLSRYPSPRSRSGMTLIEALIAIAITASLLVALAAAFHASAGAVQFNNAYFQSTQSARVAVNDMTGEIRRADAVEVDADGIRMRVTGPAGLRADGEIYREYLYDPATQRLTVQLFHSGNTSTPAYELASGVTACTFTPDVQSDASGRPIVTHVSVSITCMLDGTQATLNASAAPRRAQQAYNASP